MKENVRKKNIVIMPTRHPSFENWRFIILNTIPPCSHYFCTKLIFKTKKLVSKKIDGFFKIYMRQSRPPDYPKGTPFGTILRPQFWWLTLSGGDFKNSPDALKNLAKIGSFKFFFGRVRKIFFFYLTKGLQFQKKYIFAIKQIYSKCTSYSVKIFVLRNHVRVFSIYQKYCNRHFLSI